MGLPKGSPSRRQSHKAYIQLIKYTNAGIETSHCGVFEASPQAGDKKNIKCIIGTIRSLGKMMVVWV